MTLPFIVVCTSAFENCRANDKPAVPSANRPVSASDSELISPSAMMFAVLPAVIVAPSDTVMWDVILASLTAIDNANCFDCPPGLGVLSRSFDVLELMLAAASPDVVMTTDSSVETISTPL